MTKRIRHRKVCPACNGKGKSYGRQRCGACNGTHRVTETIYIDDDGCTSNNPVLENIFAEMSTELRKQLLKELAEATRQEEFK